MYDPNLEFVFLSASPVNFLKAYDLIQKSLRAKHPHWSLHIIPMGMGIRFLLRGQSFDLHAIWNLLLEGQYPEPISAVFAFTVTPKMERPALDISEVNTGHLFYFFVSQRERDGFTEKLAIDKSLQEVAKESLIELYSVGVSDKTLLPNGKPPGDRISKYIEGPLNGRQKEFHVKTKYLGLILIRGGEHGNENDAYLKAASIRSRLYEKLYGAADEDTRRSGLELLAIEIVPARVIWRGTEYLSPLELLNRGIEEWRQTDSRGDGTIRFSWWPETEISDPANPDVEIPCGALAILGKAKTGKSVLASHVLYFAAKSHVDSGKNRKPLRVIYLNYKFPRGNRIEGVEELQHLAYAWRDEAICVKSQADIENWVKSDPEQQSQPEEGLLWYVELKGEYEQVGILTRQLVEAIGKLGDAMIVFDELINFCKLNAPRDKDGKPDMSALTVLSTTLDTFGTKNVYPVLITQQLEDFEEQKGELGKFASEASLVLTALDPTSANHLAFDNIQKDRPDRIYPTKLSFEKLTQKYELGTFFLSITASSKYGFIPQKYTVRQDYPSTQTSLRKRLNDPGIRPGDFSWKDFLDPDKYHSSDSKSATTGS